MNPSIPAQIARNRRYIRARLKPRIGILGQADGTLYHPDSGKYWARWRGSKDANGNATHGQPFPVWAGETNYLPHAGRQIYIGTGFDGKLTILGAVPDDLVNAELDARAHNPNDPYRHYVYLVNAVPFRSDALADEGNDTLKVNLNQLFYRDAYGQFNRWNGTDENTHLDLADYATVTIGADEHQYALVTLRTLENLPAVYVSTPKSEFLDLDFADIQECVSKADPECIDSRVWRIASDQTTLIASPVTDLDMRQWINVPARLGNPTVITERLRVRANHQLIYYGEVQVLGELHVLGEVLLLGIDEGSGVTDTGITELTGDVTAGPGSGSQAATLATVNSAPGTLHGVNRMAVNAKGLVTEAVEGANWIKSVRAMPANVSLTPITYNNGSSGVGATITKTGNGALPAFDGITMVVNDRVLINQSHGSSVSGGIYTVTDLGSAGTPWILTRAPDADEPADLYKSMVFVEEGTTLGKSIWFMTQPPVVIGTNVVSYAEGSANKALSNLASVAINTSLISDTDNTDDLGSSAIKWRGVFANAVTYEERTAPSTPATADYVTYSKAVGGGAALFGIDDAGVEKQISRSIAIIADQKSSGTNGGTSTSATQNARDLNTELSDVDGIVTISSNKFVVIAGTYKYRIDAPFRGGSAARTEAQSRLYNVTAAAVVTNGTGQNATAAINGGAVTNVQGLFTSNGTDEYRIDTYTSIGRATDGLGAAIAVGTETYTTVLLEKVG